MDINREEGQGANSKQGKRNYETYHYCEAKPLTGTGIGRENSEVNGVGCLQLKVDHMGYLDNFSRVYASEETRANVLSFTEVKEIYHIILRDAFIILDLPEQDLIVLRRKGELYIVDFVEQ